MYPTHREMKGRKNLYHCPSGQKVELRHRPCIHKDGRRELIKDREVPIFDQIQSYKDDCEIENIIRRAIEGDYNALNQRKGNYIDITGVPTSLAQAQQMIIEIKQKFNELPKEIKAQFDYNPEVYVAEFGSDSWAEKTGIAEAIKKQQAAAERAAQIDAAAEQAILNLAQGTKITQEGGNNNES